MRQKTVLDEKIFANNDLLKLEVNNLN